jgi:hypothetical protein
MVAIRGLRFTTSITNSRAAHAIRARCASISFLRRSYWLMCINTSLVSETERPNREILDKNCQKQRLLCSIRLNSTSSLEKFERELSDLITQSRR